MSESLACSPLAAVADIVMGQSPPSSTVFEEARGLPFLQGCAEFGPRHPRPKLHCDPPLRVAKAGSTLISVRAPVGTINVADRDYSIGRGLGAVAPRPGIADGRFLQYAIESATEYLHRRSQGSTFLAIGTAELHSMPIPRFNIEKQRRIAEILSTVDEAIEQTEALIAKTQQIKAGLMHDLFTRGVTPDGRLRPPREEAPELYKESELGWIPREWEVVAASDLCTNISVGIVIRPAQYYVESGVPTLRSANVREEGIDDADLVFISPESHQKLQNSALREGDVVTVRTGYPGTSAVVPRGLNGANCVDILISRPCGAIESDYLAAWINSSFGKDQVLRRQGGLAQQHFNVGDLRTLLVSCPIKQEQVAMMERRALAQKRLASEKNTVESLKTLKKGLMMVLLGSRNEGCDE